jgi:RNA-directed DNA polymerase
MNYFDFDKLENIDDIAGALGCQANFIQFVLDYPATFYQQLRVPRRRRSDPRIVYEVNDKLKNLHKNILVSIAAKVNFPEYVQGFVSKRSIVTNASLHLGQKYVLNLDIKNFFESIKTEKVICVFESLGCNHEVASILAKLCTLNDCLVQGANTSPILANLVCIELDKELVEIGLKYECSYSRYADDITFSGARVPKKKHIARCIEKYNFQLNPEKWKCQSRGKAQYVTGLTVFDEAIPRLPKQVKRHLRQELYYADKYGLLNHLQKTRIQGDSASYINRIDGLIAFMYSVEPKCACNFDIMWQEIRSKENLPKSRDPSKIFNKCQLQKSLNYPSSIEQPAQEIQFTNQLHE